MLVVRFSLSMFLPCGGLRLLLVFAALVIRALAVGALAWGDREGAALIGELN